MGAGVWPTLRTFTDNLKLSVGQHLLIYPPRSKLAPRLGFAWYLFNNARNSARPRGRRIRDVRNFRPACRICHPSFCVGALRYGTDAFARLLPPAFEPWSPRCLR